jgi:hypothetical protein
MEYEKTCKFVQPFNVFNLYLTYLITFYVFNNDMLKYIF